MNIGDIMTLIGKILLGIATAIFVGALIYSVIRRKR